MIRGPRIASAAVMSNMIATLNLQAYFEAHIHSLEPPVPPWGGLAPSGPKVFSLTLSASH